MCIPAVKTFMYRCYSLLTASIVLAEEKKAGIEIEKEIVFSLSVTLFGQ